MFVGSDNHIMNVIVGFKSTKLIMVLAFSKISGRSVTEMVRIILQMRLTFLWGEAICFLEPLPIPQHTNGVFNYYAAKVIAMVRYLQEANAG